MELAAAPKRLVKRVHDEGVTGLGAEGADLRSKGDIIETNQEEMPRLPLDLFVQLCLGLTSTEETEKRT